MRRLLAVLPMLALAGCLGDGDGDGRPGARQARAVTGSVALGAGAGVARTERSAFVLRGHVQPADSDVRVLDARYGGLSAIPERRGGEFTARLTGLAPGVNRYVVEAVKPGHRPWRLDVRVIRRAAARALPRIVAVPAVDRTPPASAVLRLDRERLIATAIGTDAGGMARIRVSAALRVACGDGAERPFVLHVPGPMVAKVKVVPGTRVPTRLERRTSLLRAATRRCGGPVRRVTGRAWAEATDAAGRDRYSPYARIPPRP